jgi:NAD(P)-dependent dehydrogenase (short-subunit alcohol dehydrogenase family)
VVAETLAAEGAEVILVSRTESQLLETAKTIDGYGIKSHVVVTDLADEDSIGGLIEYVNSHFSKLDILVNNAGVTHSGLINKTATASWDQCMAVNARAPFILCRELLAPLKKSKAGYIINIASVVGVKGYAKQTAYTASKHALRGMSMTLAEELRATNIRVHVICPGGVETEMVTQVRPDIPTDELIQPREVADLILYLVTHQGNGVVDELNIRRKSSNPWF